MAKQGRRAQENFNETTRPLGGDKHVVRFASDREELVLINDGNANLIFTAGAIKNFRLEPGEIFDEEVNPFNTIEITASSTFRGYIREEY